MRNSWIACLALSALLYAAGFVGACAAGSIPQHPGEPTVAVIP